MTDPEAWVWVSSNVADFLQRCDTNLVRPNPDSVSVDKADATEPYRSCVAPAWAAAAAKAPWSYADIGAAQCLIRRARNNSAIRDAIILALAANNTVLFQLARAQAEKK